MNNATRELATGHHSTPVRLAVVPVLAISCRTSHPRQVWDSIRFRTGIQRHWDRFVSTMENLPVVITTRKRQQRLERNAFEIGRDVALADLIGQGPAWRARRPEHLRSVPSDEGAGR